MKSYLVGGAVRDELLGRSVHDRDYVVTGMTIEQMLKAGFQKVGADFPVFLHPQSKEEYALARTERKSGKGYKGFTVDFNPDVTLEEDLLRRDLTINAIAKDNVGNYVDPYQGQQDLADRILRHVSPAFAEDPLRVLRVARFAAQLKPFGFVVHPDTNSLMAQLSHSGELSSLTAERVFKETEKALSCDHPQVYFEVLNSAQALEVLFPEFAENKEAFNMAMTVLAHSAQLSELPEVRWAALLGAVSLSNSSLSAELKSINERHKVPNRYALLAQKVVQLFDVVSKLKDARTEDNGAENVLSILVKLDVFRKQEILEPFIAACRAVAQLAKGEDFEQGNLLNAAAEQCLGVIAKPFVEQGIKGAKIKEAMTEQRLHLIAGLLSK